MKRKNSFDFVRLLAASLVVFSHSFALTGHPEPHLGGVSLGTIGVWTFFIISGFLIATSWDQYPRFNVFFAKRMLRIFPGLAVVLLLTVIACGLFYSTVPFLQYLVHPETLRYLNNIFLINGSNTLPGVFENSPYPLAVNGSIWTLLYEFVMYLAVALIGVTKLYKHISAVGIWLILFVFVIVMNIIGAEHFKVNLFYLDISQISTLALMFFSGIVMYKESKRITLDARLGFLSLTAFIVLSLLLPTWTFVFAPTLLAYALFAIAKNPMLSWVGKYGDFSYGIYIYSFPIQQMLISSTQTTSPYKVFLASLTLSVIAGALSWFLIESRALQLKTRINVKKYPLHQADESW